MCTFQEISKQGRPSLCIEHSLCVGQQVCYLIKISRNVSGCYGELLLGALLCLLHYTSQLMSVRNVFQERIAKAHGSQCGFCTPGIVMSMYALLRNNPTPRMADVEEAFHGTPRQWDMLLLIGAKNYTFFFFSGNLCRCTGYRPILEGFKTFTVVRPMLIVTTSV